VDVWSRIFSLTAFLISVFTFTLQFVARDAVSYNIAQAAVAKWPKDGNAYFGISLNIFNRGNRPAALVSATARLVKRQLKNDQGHVTDADCSTQLPFLELFAGTAENLQRYIGSVQKYTASVEAAKCSQII
jgi:hypothetical protein